MTNEEAAKCIERIRSYMSDEYFSDADFKAMDMAIEALQSAPSTSMSNLIDRQAAIDEIETTSFDDYGDYMRARELIEQLPSAQPTCNDLEQVVRCRDCKYWEGEYIDGFWYFEECSLNQRGALSDDFCSRAERR